MKNKTILITGAAMGQGADAAKMMAAQGYCVGLVDIDEKALHITADEIIGHGGKAVCLLADVSSREAVQSAFERFELIFGPVWAAASAAAILPAGDFIVDIAEVDWEKILSVNLLGTVNVCTVAARSMIKNKMRGRIVNWSSVNAVVSGPCFASYATGKAAVEMFSRSLAVELAAYGITVNCIRPGSIETPMMFDMTDDDKMRESERIPLGRWGMPKDTSAVLRFLLSDGAEWMTGSTITIDGGAIAVSGNPDQKVLQRRMDKRKY